jgi:anion-transporting  ArsA/GET3 family ATPase
VINLEQGGFSPNIGIKPSRKYANGSIHENGSGKFEILDRYSENNIKMLKYKWLTGENEGTIETNKEVNVNASIWKFKKVRGLTDSDKKNQPSVDDDLLQEIIEKLDEIQEFQNEFRNFQVANSDTQQSMVEVHEKLSKQTDIIRELLVKLEKAFTDIHELNRKIDLAEKLVEKM